MITLHLVTSPPSTVTFSWHLQYHKPWAKNLHQPAFICVLMFIVVLGLRSYAQAALYLWQVRATPWLQRMDFLLQRLLLKTSGVGGTQASVDVVHRLSCPEVGGVPRPEIESTSPAQIGRFLTTGPPGKSICLLLNSRNNLLKKVPFTNEYFWVGTQMRKKRLSKERGLPKATYLGSGRDRIWSLLCLILEPLPSFHPLSVSC